MVNIDRILLGKKLSQEQSDRIFTQAPIKKCRCCNAELKGIRINWYHHKGGWKIEGMSMRVWLFIICPKCSYQNALWKLGYNRS